MGQVISAGILLVVVVAIYIAVSYKHEKSGLGKGCDGNCGSCGLRSCKTCLLYTSDAADD